MKKILLLVTLILMLPIACTVTTTTTTSTTTSTTSTTTTTTTTISMPTTTTTTRMTPFEIVQEVKNALDLGVDVQDVRSNLVLPREIVYGTAIVLIVWQSNAKDIINIEGHVVRPAAGMGAATVTLTATLSYSGTVDYRDFVLTVTEMPSGDLALVEEAAANLVLWPEAKLDRDFLVLPRIGDFSTSIEWISSDVQKIDLEGNVTLPAIGQTDQTVILSATISLGQAMVFRDYAITLTAPDPMRGQPVTLADTRILRIVSVNEKIALLSAVLNALPGDAIVLESGNYFDVNFTMRRSGTKDHPIFILARTPGGAIIQGESQMNVEADHVILANLTFTNGRPSGDQGAIVLEGDYLRLSNTLIDNFDATGYDYKWVSLTGRFHEVDNNTFDGKDTGGSLLTIWRNDNSPQFHWIHHNLFLNYKDAGGANGYETIRVGTSTYSQSDSYVTIEQNRFEEVNGEIEIISIKSGRVHIRGNTFVRSLGHVTSRHGKNNVIEDNVFFGEGLTDTGGVRAYDGGHIIRNNYIEGIVTSSNTRAGIVIHSGVNVPGTNTVLNAQWTSFDLLVEHNTIVDSRQSILFDGKYSYPSVGPLLRNNLIVARRGFAAVRYDAMPVDAVFVNNRFYSDTAYAGGGSVVTVAVPQGVQYTNSLLPLTRNAAGLLLHETWGASDLWVMKQTDVGVSWLKTE